jgi:hypothetical protein
MYAGAALLVSLTAAQLHETTTGNLMISKMHRKPTLGGVVAIAFLGQPLFSNHAWAVLWTCKNGAGNPTAGGKKEKKAAWRATEGNPSNSDRTVIRPTATEQ